MRSNWWWCLFFWPVLASGQEFNFKTYSLPEGLGQAQVTDMLEDRHGRMWFATFGGGVSVFNGKRFTTYTADDGLGGNFSNCLETVGDTIWVGGDEGLSYIYQNIIHTYGYQDGLWSDTVVVLEKVGNTLWIGTPKGLQTMSLSSLTHFTALSVPERSVSFAQATTRGTVWLGFTHAGVVEVTQEGKVLQRFKRGAGIASSEVRCLAENPDILAIGTYGKGLQVCIGDSLVQRNSNNGFPDDVILHLRFEGDRLWVATQKSGVLVLDTDSLQVQYAINQRNTLPSNQIMKTLRDRWGNHWFSTRGRGVARHYAPEIVHYTKRSGMPNETVLALHQMPDSSMLVSTKDGHLLQMRGDSLFHMDAFERKIQANVRCMLHDTLGNLWLGTDGKGLFRWNGETWKNYGRADGLTYRWVKDLALDTAGRLWAGTLGGGLYFLQDERFVSAKTQFPELDFERAECLLATVNGSLWVGTRKNGIIQLRGAELIRHQSAGLGSAAIRDLAVDANGQIWAATSKGLFAIGGEVIRHFGKDDGLVSGNLFGLKCHNQYLLLATDRGVTQLSQTEDAVELVYHYGYEQGFTGIEAMQSALLLDHQEKLWCGAVSALTIIDFQHRPKQARVTVPFFEKAFLFEQPLNDTLLAKLPTEDGRYEFQYDQNAFTFEFMGINQFEPDAVRYKWQLKGYEAEMSLPQEIGRVTYSQLPPGSYTFTFATGVNGIWSEPKEVLQFSILQPFWQRTWFLVVAMTFIALLISSGLYVRIRNIRRRSNQENEQLRLKNQLLALESKALQLQMNPHFIFNALNSVKGLIAVDDLKSAKVYLSRFAKLMRRILENSRDPFVSLESELEMIDLYLQLENQALEKTFHYSISCEAEIDAHETLIPPMLLQPFVENAVKHAMRYKSGDGQISLHVLVKGDVLQCAISDNGPGRGAVRDKQMAEQQHRSMALEITAERLQSFGPDYGVQIEDVVENNEVKGTMVTLQIPVQHA